MNPNQANARPAYKRTTNFKIGRWFGAGRFVGLWLILLLTTLLSLSGAFASSKITYHGRIVGQDGAPLEGKVDFKIQILDSSEQCLLYEEIHTINEVKNGIFALQIGESPSQQSPSNTIEKVFKSDGSLMGSGGCTPSAGRKLALSFSLDGGVSWENVPPTAISSVPQAIESQSAQSVGGFSVENLLRVEEGGEPKSAPKFTQSEADELLLLARGQSTRYMRIENSVVTLPSYSSDPMSPPPAGSVWFEGNEIKFSSGTTVVTLGAGGGGSGGVASVTSGDSIIQVNNTDPANPKISLNTAQVEAQLSGSFASINDPRFDESIKNAGGIVSIQAGNDAGKPAAGTIGRLYVAIDTQRIYRDNGTGWDLIAEAGSGGGGGSGVTEVLAGTGLSGGGSSGSVTLNLADSSVNPDTYGSASEVARFTVDQQGRITQAENVAISGVAPGGAAGGDLGGTYPNPKVEKIQGHAVSSTTLTAGDAGKVYVWNGSSLTPKFFGISDLKNSLGVSYFPQCTASQTLTWVSATDTISCTDIAISSAQVSGLGAAAALGVGTGLTISGGNIVVDFGTGAGKVVQGNDARLPSAACDEGRKMRWNGNAWVCEVDSDSGGTITALTGDVTAAGLGTVSATVEQVGGVSAANIAAGATLANNATNTNAANAIVRRDASGNFSANEIAASLFKGDLQGNVTGQPRT